MNFIITLALWGFIFLVSTVTKSFTTPGSDGYIACIVFQIAPSAMAFIFIIVAMFYHMSWFREAQKKVNCIKRYKREADLNNEMYEKLRDYYQKYLAEQYPQMEKDIFLKIAESQPKELVALLQSYPELKTSTVFMSMIKQTTELVEKIYEKYKHIEQEIEDLENIKTDPWLIWKPKVEVGNLN